jgi:hypothetical protein
MVPKLISEADTGHQRALNNSGAKGDWSPQKLGAQENAYDSEYDLFCGAGHKKTAMMAGQEQQNGGCRAGI